MCCLDGFIYSEVRVEGLETLDFLDNLVHRKRFTEQADALTFDGEVPKLLFSRFLWRRGVKNGGAGLVLVCVG